jgi:hypothetical protein
MIGSMQDHYRLCVQRHVATLSEPKVPDVPVLTRRTDEDDGGDYTPIRTAIRTIGNRIPDGGSVFVGVRKGLRASLSAHQRIELERVRAGLSDDCLEVLDKNCRGTATFVRRIGDAARLEQVFDGGYVYVDHVHVVPLPLCSTTRDGFLTA